jgi:hypothetical protein
LLVAAEPLAKEHGAERVHVLAADVATIEGREALVAKDTGGAGTLAGHAGAQGHKNLRVARGLRDGLAGRFATGFGAAPRFLVRGLVCDQAPNPHAQRQLAH